MQHKHNTRQQKYNTRHHKHNKTLHDTTRMQQETTRVQNNLKFVLIYLYHHCMLGACSIRLWSSVYVVKFRKLKIAFSSNNENRNFLRESFWKNVNCSRIFSRVSYFGETRFRLRNQLVQKKKVNKEGMKEYFHKINYQKL